MYSGIEIRDRGSYSDVSIVAVAIGAGRSVSVALELFVVLDEILAPPGIISGGTGDVVEIFRRRKHDIHGVRDG
jgi:hypothetical protein